MKGFIFAMFILPMLKNRMYESVPAFLVCLITVILVSKFTRTVDGTDTMFKCFRQVSKAKPVTCRVTLRLKPGRNGVF
ncbi:hypothetical protein ISS30_09700 [bacterium]|nr:hypothetical protein [FCB group bacterium]MBL7191958.1 hypothetical protein [bacterium]